MVKQLPPIVPELNLRLHSTKQSDRPDSVTHYINVLCMELSWLDEWAVWNRSKQSLTFLQIGAKGSALTVENSVMIDFDKGTNSRLVVFHCTSSNSDLRLQFDAQPQNLISYIHSLLRSFQVSMVVTHKIAKLIDPSMQDGFQVDEKNLTFSPAPVKVENTASVSSGTDAFSHVKLLDLDSLVRDGYLPKAEPTDSACSPYPIPDDENKFSTALEDYEIPPLEDAWEPVSQATIGKKMRSKRNAEHSSTKHGKRITNLTKKRNNNHPKSANTGSCRFCNVTIHFSEASNHMLTTHAARNTECCFCPNSFDSVERLHLHVAMYHPRRSQTSNRLKCTVCHIYISKSESYDHMLLEHQRAGECPFCDYHLENDSLSSREVNEFIDVGDTIPFSLKDHIRRMHRFLNKTTQWRRPKKTILNLNELKGHEKNRDPVKRKMCTLCGVRPDNLAKHQAFKHGLNRESVYKYKCTFCEKTYTNSWHLRTHLLRNHLQDKKICCSKCPSSFASESLLDRHMVTHEQPTIKCPKPQCDKFFKRKPNVLQHLQGCHYPPQYQCLLCHDQFYFRDKVRAHLKSQHNSLANDQTFIQHKINMVEDMVKLKNCKY